MCKAVKGKENGGTGLFDRRSRRSFAVFGHVGGFAAVAVVGYGEFSPKSIEHRPGETVILGTLLGEAEKRRA